VQRHQSGLPFHHPPLRDSSGHLTGEAIEAFIGQAHGTDPEQQNEQQPTCHADRPEDG
jgi:hypothetical protein